MSAAGIYSAKRRGESYSSDFKTQREYIALCLLLFKHCTKHFCQQYNLC